MRGTKVTGRKRHIVVDTEGNLLRVWVHPANLQDRTAARWWLDVVREAFPTLRLLFADAGYAGAVVDWAKRQLDLTIEVVKKAAEQTGFVVLARRWVVERSLAWYGRNRRRAKDYEELPECSETWVYFASIRLIVRRLAASDSIS